jgi:CO/xanthine dehydrogenase Mo-binding subunit
MTDYRVVGKSVERTDARVKVTRSARHTGDVVAPGIHHDTFLRSPVARAKILDSACTAE